MMSALSSGSCGQVEYQSSCFLANSDMAAGRQRVSGMSRREKCVAHTERTIQPRFISETIREPPIRTTNGDVDYQIEGCPQRAGSVSAHPV